jgi:hypothetical protein
MKSITIHGMEKPLASMLKAKAQEEGQSLNKTIKQLLESALGIKVPAKGAFSKDFTEFRDVWSHTDLNIFRKATEDFSSIDKEDWK